MEKHQFLKTWRLVGSTSLALSLAVLAGCGKSEFQSATEAAAGIDSNMSKMILPTSSVLADGVTQAPILLQLRDSKGRGVSGIQLTLMSSGSGNTIIPCTKSDSSGNATCQMMSNIAEWKNLVTLGKVILTGKVLFNLPVPSTTLFSIVSSGDLQALPSGHRITTASGTIVTPVDLKNNLGVRRFRSSHMGALLPME